MSDNATGDHISKKRVVYNPPGTDAVAVRRDVAFHGADASELAMDVYYPEATEAGARPPVVVIVAGYPDPGFERAVGCRFKEMGSSVSWGRLFAASGIAAITYTNKDPVRDLTALVAHVRRDAGALGVDAGRMGLWASSGSVPLALSVLIENGDGIRCATLCYGLTLDLDGGTGVASAAAAFHFGNPAAGKSVGDLPRQVPMFLVRAGQDHFAGLNEAMDRFTAHALAANLPITVVNFPEAPHAFDLLLDTDASRELIRQILAFMRFNLGIGR